MRAVSQVPVAVTFQSYFDNTLLQKAILEQPANELIVPSTKKEYQGSGYAVALAATSDFPVTLKFQGGRDSGHYILRPGEVVTPGPFEGFTYGLPFGWLGGGLALLKIAHAADVRLDPGPGRNEVIFHRTRLKIVTDAAGPTLVNNWPLRFPWTQAVFGTNSIDQKGNSILTVEPTRVLLRLRLNIVVDKTVRFAFRGSHDFDQGSDGTVTTTFATNATYSDVVFSANVGTSAPYPLAELPASLARLACDEGGVNAIDLGDAALTDQYVDVVRYGRI